MTAPTCPPDFTNPYDTDPDDPLGSPAAGDLAYDKSGAEEDSVFDGSQSDDELHGLTSRKEVKEAEVVESADAAEASNSYPADEPVVVVDVVASEEDDDQDAQDDGADAVEPAPPAETAPVPPPPPVEVAPAPVVPVVPVAPVEPVEAEQVAPEKKLPTPADLRTAADYYQEASDHLDAAANAIEKGDKAQEAEAELDGQGGGKGESAPAESTTVDEVDTEETDTERASNELVIDGLELNNVQVKINGQPVEVDIEIGSLRITLDEDGSTDEADTAVTTSATTEAA